MDNAILSLTDKIAQLEAEIEHLRSERQSQVAEFAKASEEIINYQGQLRKLASELSLAEARERREIASDLHDHIGQSLALIKMKISQFQGNAIFCGFEQNINEIMSQLDKTIKYTRTLTFEISSPVLYELGLEAAIEREADLTQDKFGFKTKVTSSGQNYSLPTDVQVVLFKSVQELLLNAAKHGDARNVSILITRSESSYKLTLEDDGRGFDVSVVANPPDNRAAFGLFSIKERLAHLGGMMTIESNSGKGTSVFLVIPLAQKN
jgi:signal transduction histidine kinase